MTMTIVILLKFLNFRKAFLKGGRYSNPLDLVFASGHTSICERRKRRCIIFCIFGFGHLSRIIPSYSKIRKTSIKNQYQKFKTYNRNHDHRQELRTLRLRRNSRHLWKLLHSPYRSCEGKLRPAPCIPSVPMSTGSCSSSLHEGTILSFLSAAWQHF